MRIEDLSITAEGNVYSLNEFIHHAGHKTTYAKSAAAFLKSWINGETQFTFNTSGSTGEPRQITFHRSQLEASAKATQNALGLNEGMTSLICLDTRFIAGAMMLVRSLVVRMNMIIEAPTGTPLAAFMGDTHIDFAALVPYQVHQLLNSKDRLNTLGTVIIGGAAVDHLLAQQLQQVDTACYATFGMTETISHIALQKLNGHEKSDRFITLEGITVSKDDRDCLVISATFVNDRPIVTNDLIELYSPNQFRWIGRLDNVINSGGIKVIPEKVEKTIGSIMEGASLSNRHFITGIPHQSLGFEVVLIIEGMFSNTAEEMILTRMREQLDRFELPRRILYCEVFQETETKKVDRKRSALNAVPRPGLK